MSEIQQLHTNTVDSVRKEAHQWISQTSSNLLNQYRFDKPYSVDKSRYLIIDAMTIMLCSNLECDYELTDCVLEKMNKYIQQKYC